MNRVPVFECAECGRPFFSARSAERAAFGSGCPGCGGSDVVEFVPRFEVETRLPSAERSTSDRATYRR
jgi:hypothetical protein